MTDRRTHILSPYELLQAQCRVLVALMLRDLASRFFGSKFGFLISLAWPLINILILLMINSAVGRTAPYGDSVALWYATGIVPFMAFSYMARFIMLGIVFNRPLLAFPAVKITDLLISRAIVEMLSAGCVILILAVIFAFSGIDFMPTDIVQASYALASSMVLGLGLGVINAIIAAAVPTWITGYALLQIVMWLASGVYFVPDALPQQLQVPLSYNPITQAIEWMRSAYYEGYGSTFLNKPYLLGFAGACLFGGLLLERLTRGKLLQ